MGHLIFLYIDVTIHDSQFEMNEEHDAFHVGPWLGHHLSTKFPMLASESYKPYA
jgi:hypothetical protein